MSTPDLLMVDARAVITRRDIFRWTCVTAAIVVGSALITEFPLQRMSDQLFGVVMLAFILCGLTRDRAKFT
jgi:hypothetical protein